MDPRKIQEPEWVFPFEGMEVGDSFFIPTLRPAEMVYIVDGAAKRVKMRVRSFPSTKEGHLGVRVWRIR